MLQTVPAIKETKAKKTYLTNDQMEQLALFVFNDARGVELTPIEKEFSKWRVDRSILVNEANAKFGYDIGFHQIHKAVFWYLDILKRAGTHVELMALPATVHVQNERDKIEIARLGGELEKLQRIVTSQASTIALLSAKLSVIQGVMHPHWKAPI